MIIKLNLDNRENSFPVVSNALFIYGPHRNPEALSPTLPQLLQGVG